MRCFIMIPNIFYKAFLPVLLFALSLSCSKKNSSPGPRPNPSGIDSQKILADLGPATQYYQLAEDHTDKGEIILLTAQGGPVTDVSGQDFDSMHDFFSIAYVHQAQTLRNQSDGLDHRLLSGSEIISIDKARRASMKSAAILHKVSDHFKQQGYTVYLITHSFGSFIIPHTLAHYGNNFDKIIIGAGRLEIQQEVYESFLNGCGGQFSSDGVTFQAVTCEDVRREENLDTQGFQAFRSGRRLQGALGENRYRQLLQDVPLENVLYIYGNADEAVGRLSSEEVTFLKNKKAQVMALDTGHDIIESLEFLEDSPDTRSLLADDANTQMMNFLMSPLPSSYDVLNMPEDAKMATYLQSSSSDTYKIGIVFENHSPQQVSYKLDAAFGDGPFSLFKTNVFKDHKSKFHIEFGRITQDEDENAFNFTKEQKKAFGKLFVQTFPEFQSRESLGITINNFLEKHSISDTPFYYFDAIKLKELIEQTTLTATQEDRKRELEQSRDRFVDFLKNTHNQNKNFDLVIYVSPGISGGYADSSADTNIHPAPRVIYMPSSEFLNVFMPSMGLHSDYYAITLVHELGHIFGDLADEYYSYEVETSVTPIKADLRVDIQFNYFRNNCFRWYNVAGFSGLIASQANISHIARRDSSDQISIYYPRGTTDVPSQQVLNFDFDLTNILNPWTHNSKVPFFDRSNDSTTQESGSIANYNANLYGGCNGGKSFRGTENSIMRLYHLYRAKDWPDAWGPINSYYLKRGLDLQ